MPLFFFSSTPMQLTNKQTLIIVTVAGVAIYLCEWLWLIAPGFCDENIPLALGSFRLVLMKMYVLPLVLAVGIGYFGYKTPAVCWLLFMMPSSTLKMGSLYHAGGNLAPPMFALEVVLFILTGLIIGGVAMIRTKWQRVRP